jgi:hypothetical protein
MEHIMELYPYIEYKLRTMSEALYNKLNKKLDNLRQTSNRHNT